MTIGRTSKPTIYKYWLRPSHEAIWLPTYAGAKLLHVHAVSMDVALWAMVDTSCQQAERKLYVLGTGWDLAEYPTSMQYVGTAHTGAFVWHVFDGMTEAVQCAG